CRRRKRHEWKTQWLNGRACSSHQRTRMPGVGNAGLMPRSSIVLHPSQTQAADPLLRNGSAEWLRLLVSGAGRPRRAAHIPAWSAFILVQLILGFLPAMAAEIRWASVSNRIYVTGP